MTRDSIDPQTRLTRPARFYGYSYTSFSAFSDFLPKDLLLGGWMCSWPKLGSPLFTFFFHLSSFWAFGPPWSFSTSWAGPPFVMAQGPSLSSWTRLPCYILDLNKFKTLTFIRTETRILNLNKNTQIKISFIIIIIIFPCSLTNQINK